MYRTTAILCAGLVASSAIATCPSGTPIFDDTTTDLVDEYGQFDYVIPDHNNNGSIDDEDFIAEVWYDLEESGAFDKSVNLPRWDSQADWCDQYTAAFNGQLKGLTLDFDEDDDIDSDDTAHVTANIGKTKPAAADGDVDGDGDVDTADATAVSGWEGYKPAVYVSTDGSNMTLAMINIAGSVEDLLGSGYGIVVEYLVDQSNCNQVTGPVDEDDYCSDGVPSPFPPDGMPDKNAALYVDCTCADQGQQIAFWPEGGCDCTPTGGATCGVWTQYPINGAAPCGDSRLDGFSVGDTTSDCTFKLGDNVRAVLCCWDGKSLIRYWRHPKNQTDATWAEAWGLINNAAPFAPTEPQWLGCTNQTPPGSGNYDWNFASFRAPTACTLPCTTPDEY